MAKTREQIQMNYQKMLRQAADLEALARQLGTITDEQLEDTIQNVHAAWEGEAAEKFCRKGERLCLLFRQRGRKLQEIAETVRNSANRTYCAEMRSVEIAEKRKY